MERVTHLEKSLEKNYSSGAVWIWKLEKRKAQTVGLNVSGQRPKACGLRELRYPLKGNRNRQAVLPNPIGSQKETRRVTKITHHGRTKVGGGLGGETEI